jgi:glycosyltransferase involved in cell wall biosynthesis
MDCDVSVIIPVYNAVRELELVLGGYLRQTCRAFGLFIADDGSGPEVRASVESFSRRAPFPVRYVSQPDEGYRKTQALNLAVRATAASYLIFADADCIPHAEFVAAHLKWREKRAVLCGRRVNLDPKMTARLTLNEVLQGKLERNIPANLLASLVCRGGHRDEGILIRNLRFHRWINRKEPALLGSNFSLEKPLLEEVNGFNEDFFGYSGEDTELEHRLRLAGARFRWVRHRAIQYHLYHPRRASSQENLRALARSRAEGNAACRNGLRKS